MTQEKKHPLNFTDKFRDNATVLLTAEIAASKGNKLEVERYSSALATMTEDDAIAFAILLAEQILTGKRRISWACIEKVSSEIDWWTHEIHLHRGDVLVGTIVSDHLVTLALTLDQYGFRIGDSEIGIPFPMPNTLPKREALIVMDFRRKLKEAHPTMDSLALNYWADKAVQAVWEDNHCIDVVEMDRHLASISAAIRR